MAAGKKKTAGPRTTNAPDKGAKTRQKKARTDAKLHRRGAAKEMTAGSEVGHADPSVSVTESAPKKKKKKASKKRPGKEAARKSKRAAGTKPAPPNMAKTSAKGGKSSKRRGR